MRGRALPMLGRERETMNRSFHGRFMQGRALPMLGLVLLLAAGCVYPAGDRVIVIIRDTPPASPERPAAPLTQASTLPERIEIHAAPAPRVPNRLPASIVVDEPVKPASAYQVIKAVRPPMTLVPIEATPPNCVVEPRQLVLREVKPVVEKKIIAVGAPKGVDPLLLEPPPPVGRSVSTMDGIP